MNIFPRLHTPRLQLRKIQIEDIPSLVKYANNKKIADHIVNIFFPYREPEATFRIAYVNKGFKNKTHYAFSIISKEHQELIGEISLHLLDKHQHHAQLAYWIGEPFWNQGIATEAAKAIIQFGFEQLKVDLIFADCLPQNIGSQKVMTKNGLTQHPSKSKYLVFKLTKEDYFSKKE